MEEKMSFLVKDDDDVLDKYNEIWCKIKKTLNAKFHSMPDYGGKYIKGEVREFGVAIKKNFLGDETPKENVDYTCIAYWFCYENKRNELFRRMQIQNKENKDV